MNAELKQEEPAYTMARLYRETKNRPDAVMAFCEIHGRERFLDGVAMWEAIDAYEDTDKRQWSDQ